MLRPRFDMSPPVLPNTYREVEREWKRLEKTVDVWDILQGPSLARRLIALSTIMTNVRCGVPFGDLQQLSFDELVRLSAIGRSLREAMIESNRAGARVTNIIKKRLRFDAANVFAGKSSKKKKDKMNESIFPFLELLSSVIR